MIKAKRRKQQNYQKVVKKELRNNNNANEENNLLQYEIKVDNKRILKLTLTKNQYKRQFVQFVKNNKLSKGQATRIKQLIKSKLDEELSKIHQQEEQQDHQHGQSITWGQQEQIERGQQYMDRVEDIEVNKKNHNTNSNEEQVIVQNDDIQQMHDEAAQDQDHIYNGHEEKQQQEVTNHKVIHRKLFQNQQQQHEQQHLYEETHNNFWQQLSSIHQLQNLSSQQLEEQQQSSILSHQHHNQMCDHSHTQHHAQNYSQQLPHTNIYNNKTQNQHNLTRSQLMMKECQKMKISWKEKMKFFRLDDDGLGLQRMLKNNRKKKQGMKTNPVVNKKAKLIQPKLQQPTLFPIHSKFPVEKKSLHHQQQQQEQNLINQKIFHRLYKQETQNFKQKHSIYHPSNQKQLKDYQIVSKYNYQHACQFGHLSHKQKLQIFHNLHNASTASSMNKHHDLYSDNNNVDGNNIYGLNQIQNVINLSAKNNQSSSLSFSKRIPDMTSKVYQAPMKKRCNEHCQQFQQQKRINQQKKLSKQKQRRIRDQLKSKQNNFLSSSLNKSIKHNVKRSGECSCCHYEKLSKQKLQKQKCQRQKQRSYTPETKYSIEKLFPPYNHVSFISDVLQQSYNELFPSQK